VSLPTQMSILWRSLAGVHGHSLECQKPDDSRIQMCFTESRSVSQSPFKKVAGKVQGPGRFLKSPVDTSPHPGYQPYPWRAFLFSTHSSGSRSPGLFTRVSVYYMSADSMLSNLVSWTASLRHSGLPHIWASRRSNR